MKYDTLCDNADKTCLWHKKSFQLHFRMSRTYKSKCQLFLYGSLYSILRTSRELVILILLNIGNHYHHRNMLSFDIFPFHQVICSSNIPFLVLPFLLYCMFWGFLIRASLHSIPQSLQHSNSYHRCKLPEKWHYLCHYFYIRKNFTDIKNNYYICELTKFMSYVITFFRHKLYGIPRKDHMGFIQTSRLCF